MFITLVLRFFNHIALLFVTAHLTEKGCVTGCVTVSQEHDRQYMHIGTMVEFAFALVGKLDVINKHSFNDFKLRVGELRTKDTLKSQVLYF